MYAINLVYCVTFYKQRFMFDLFINYLFFWDRIFNYSVLGDILFFGGRGGGERNFSHLPPAALCLVMPQQITSIKTIALYHKSSLYLRETLDTNLRRNYTAKSHYDNLNTIVLTRITFTRIEQNSRI